MPSRLLSELKQTKPFRSIKEEASLSLLRTAAMVDHALNDVLREHDLTGAQYNVLRILRGAGGAGRCGKEIGERMVAPVPDVTRMLDRMEKAGLLKRERDAENRRQVLVRITPAGLRCLETVAASVAALEGRIVRTLSEAQLRALVATLEVIRENLSASADGGK